MKIAYLLIFALITATQSFVQTTVPTGAPTSANTPHTTLKIGIFADADSLPLIVADTEGLFAQEGVKVELVRFSSAIERDSALHAGKIDGAVTDVLAVVLANQGGFPLRITSLTNGRYGVAVSPDSTITSMQGLEGKDVAVSLNTIIHYFAEWSATQAKMSPSAMRLVPIPKMPVRLEMLLAGKLAAAVMPEPFLTEAKLRGARILVASDDSGLEAGVMAFPTSTIARAPNELASFYRAYWKAAQRINETPDKYRQVLVNSLSFPEDAARAFVFPSYVAPRLPSRASIESAEQWLLAKGLIKTAPDPSSIVDARLVGGW